MKQLKIITSSLFFSVCFLGATPGLSFAGNSQPLQVVAKKIRSGYVKSVIFKFNSSIMTVDLPSPGARVETFTAEVDEWGHGERVASFLLDERGQIPSIAYYGLPDKKTCLIGVHGKLTFDTESQLIVEPLYSSAIEQVIRRYEASECGLKQYDQLRDKADIEGNSGYVKRTVTRIGRGSSAKTSCEYTISEGKILDPDGCFKK
jgi:hypothetical protein